MVSCRENKMPIAMLKGSQTRHPNCTFLLRCADPTWQNIFKSWAFFESPSEILVGEIDPGYHLGFNPSATGILGVWIQLWFPILEEWHLRFLKLFETYMFGGFLRPSFGKPFWTQLRYHVWQSSSCVAFRSSMLHMFNSPILKSNTIQPLCVGSFWLFSEFPRQRQIWSSGLWFQIFPIFVFWKPSYLILFDANVSLGCFNHQLGRCVLWFYVLWFDFQGQIDGDRYIYLHLP